MSAADRNVMGVLLEALDTPKDRRRLLLDERCGVDTPLRLEVDRLIALSESDDSFLLPPLEAPLAVGPAPDRPDDLGEFRLIEEIGRGGMGVVYRARQQSLDREVALKVVTAPPASERQIESFHREARSVSRLDHPGLLPVYTDGHEGPFHFYAMELVDGHDLREEIARQRAQRDGSPEAPPILASFLSREFVLEAVRLITRVADALQHAHEHGIVHRDVKPHNILLRRDGRPQLVDFGLARDAEQADLTRSQVGGTPHYMSPEQIRGKARGVGASPQTDVFSLGVVLFELLTLERPFEGDDWPLVLEQILRSEPPRLRRLQPRIPRDLVAICEKALEKDVRRRYLSAAELTEDLRRFQHLETPLAARRLWNLNRVQRFVRRHRRVLWATLAIAVALIAGFVWAGRLGEQDRLERSLSELRVLLETESWDEVDDSRLVAAHQRSDELVGARASLSSGEALTLSAFVNRYERYAESLVERGKEEVVRGVGGGNAKLAPESDSALALRGLFRLRRAQLLLPHRPDIESALSERAFYPRISVTAVDEEEQPLKGMVSYREIDGISGLTGERIELGELPLPSTALPPGYHRIAIEVSGRGFRELSRFLRPGEELPLPVEFRADDSTTGMVLISGSSLTIPIPKDRDDCFCPNRGQTIEVPAFWIDECEVTNAEYRRFLEATEHEPPLTWRKGLLPDDPKYDDYPVVYVGWEDARAYAEWAGKRLVSHPEWDLAARGPEGRRFPWTEATALEPDEYLGNTKHSRERMRHYTLHFQLYLKYASPVRSHPDARTPEGLYHMLGNVAEWTESFVAEPVNGGFSPRTESRWVLGDAWFAAEMRGTLDIHEKQGFEKTSANYARGFRCARSVEP